MVLTKEQKQAKKEAKRLEKLKAEVEARKKMKGKELEREIAAQARRRGEVDKTWKEMMLKIKEPVFRQDIEVMWHVFERLLDKKDHLIRSTIKLMNIADDQFQRTITSFCDTIDTMINKFLNELETLSKENDIRTVNCLKSGEDEMEKITTNQNSAETHIQLLLFSAFTKADSLAWTTRGINLVQEDEDIIKYTNERDNLRSFLENNYSNMWDEYKSVLKSYIVNTAESQKRLRKLRRKENIMADIIASQGLKIKNNDGLLKRLRSELAAYETGTKQAEFRERRNRYRTACHRLKKSFTDDCALDEKLMALLVRESDGAIEWLEAGHKKGEKILRLAALCRKFETQKDKVLPFGFSIPPHQDTIPLKGSPYDDDSLVINSVSAINSFTRLWQKISNAKLSKRALFQEKRLLENENSMIMQKLQEYEENRLSPEARKCICVTQKNEDISKPVAIEGVFELYKYNNI